MNNFIEKLKKHNYRGIAQAHRYNTNPFFESYKIKLEDGFECYVGESWTETFADLNTGEIFKHNMRMAQYRKVDPEKFVKVFVNQTKFLTNLSATGDKVFIYLLTILKKDCDRFTLDIVDCLKFTKFKEKKSIYKGLVELINAGVIARGESDYEYFVNSAMVINGNRFTIMNTWLKETGQDEMPDKIFKEQRGKRLKD